jgi:hypothetical protein
MFRALGILTVAAGVLLAGAVSAQAQQADPRYSEQPQPAGWSFTPRMSTGFAYDDNVLFQGRGDDLHGDLNTAVSPAASLDYVGKRSGLNADYRGTFQLYRDLNSLNSYEQALDASARHVVSKHLLVFVQQSYTKTPTTDLQLLTGVPWVRVGARIESLRGGIESTPLKHLSINASYNYQWISFDNDPVQNVPLLGGHSNGAAVSAKYQISTRATLTADYDVERAEIVTGTQFGVQNGFAGADYRLDEYSHVYGAFGYSHLNAVDLGSDKTSPAWNGGYARRFKPFTVAVGYSRSYIPSYGGGGTLSDEEVSGSVHVPIGRRWYADGSLAWRRNESLLVNELNGLALTSVWTGVVAGYALQPWLHVEGFYGGSHQNIDRPGGLVDRHRIGIQFSTGKPMRIH